MPLLVLSLFIDPCPALAGLNVIDCAWETGPQIHSKKIGLPRALTSELSDKDLAQVEGLLQNYLSADRFSHDRPKDLLHLKLLQMGWKFDEVQETFKKASPEETLPETIPFDALVALYERVSERTFNWTQQTMMRLWEEIEDFETKYNVYVDRHYVFDRLTLRRFAKRSYTLAKDNPHLIDLDPLNRRLIPDNSEAIVVSTSFNPELTGKRKTYETSSAVRDREKIQKEVASFRDTSNIEASLYLLSGDDGVLGRELFPNSRVSVGVDSSPFVPYDKIENPLEYGSDPLTRYDHIREVLTDSAQRSLGQVILGRFKYRYPHIRIRKVVLFSAPGKRLVENPFRTSINALIEYDLGENTQPFVHLQIQSMVNTYKPLESQWWHQVITEENHLSWNALISKASMDAYRGQGDALRRSLLNYFIRNGGTVVEDTSSDTENVGSFTQRDHLSSLRRVVPNVEFGYHETAIVTVIRRPL